MPERLRLLAMKTGFRLMSAVKADRWLAPSWQVAVLMLHRVRPAAPGGFRPNAHLEITPDFLDTILSRLDRLAIPVVSLEEAAARVRRGVRGRAVVLTFDDGYRDNLDQALPVLARHRAPFTIFVATGMVDGTANAWWIVLEQVIAGADRIELTVGGTRHRYATATVGAKARAFHALSAILWRQDEAGRDSAIRDLADRNGFDIPALLAREMMTWDEIRRVASQPGATIGGHTIDHPALAMLDAAEAEREIRGGLDRIAAMTGRRPTTFAYPYGHARAVGRREIDLVTRIGLDVAVTTGRGMVTSGSAPTTAWPRVSINGLFQRERDFDVLMTGMPFALESGWQTIGRAFGRKPHCPAIGGSVHGSGARG